MKQHIKNYTFNPTNRSVTLNDFATVSLMDLYGIVNATKGVILYNPFDASKLATVNTNVITLAHNTASMDEDDVLLITYDVPTSNDTQRVFVTNQISLTEITGILTDIRNQAQAINANTNTLETKIQETVDAINTNGTVNHSDLVAIQTELQSVNANTDTLEARMLDVFNRLIAAPATEATQLSMLAKLPNLGFADPLNGTPVNLSNDVTVAGATQTAANIDLLTGSVNGWYDARAMHSACIQIIGSAGITAGQIIFEQTNDPINAATGSVIPVDEPATPANKSITTAFAISANSQRLFTFPVMAGYIRVRISVAFVGGNVRAIALLSQLPYSSNSMLALQSVAAALAMSASQAGIWTVQPGNTANTTPWLASLRPSASGGLSRHRLLSAANTNLTLLKGSAGQIYTIHAFNNGASVAYLKLYNKASAAPVIGTDAVIETYALPPNTPVRISFESIGNPFSTGIGYAITGALADSDSTPIAANQIVLMIHFL